MRNLGQNNWQTEVLWNSDLWRNASKNQRNAKLFQSWVTYPLPHETDGRIWKFSNVNYCIIAILIIVPKKWWVTVNVHLLPFLLLNGEDVKMTITVLDTYDNYYVNLRRTLELPVYKVELDDDAIICIMWILVTDISDIWIRIR